MQVESTNHQPGLVLHTVGHPLPWNVYGGGWVYHMADNRISLGCGSAFPNDTFSKPLRRPGCAQAGGGSGLF